jgi:alkylation response protein AidB-like acyl-CoA dehydrogenase
MRACCADQQPRCLGVADHRRAQFDRHEGHAAVRHARAEGALPAEARERRNDRRVLPDRIGRGSDAASIRTAAKQNADGSWTLNGEKIWITNGGIADFYTVFARTDGHRRQDHGLHRRGRLARRQPRPARGQDGHPRIDHHRRRFSDVRVPAENVLGEAGKGFKVAMAILNNGRTGLGGGAVGGMKR